MERHPNPHIENVQITRRRFLGGVGSAAALGVMTHVGLKYRDTSEMTADEEFPAEEVEVSVENYEPYSELSESGYFTEDVRRFTEELRNEVPEVLENVDTYAAIEEHFLLPTIEHATLKRNLEALAPALAFTESRYKNVASELGAFGVMQIMPATWAELAKDGEDEHDLESQIKVAARLMEQSYRHIMSSCRNELSLIEQNFFGGDTESFETAFLTPCFLNAYNAGMGTMEQLIKDFVELCPNPQSTIELFEQSETLTGYDVFIGMAHTALHQEWVQWYKDVAANYTCKVYGAHRAVADYLESQRS